MRYDVIKQAHQIRYLGCGLTNNGKYGTEIRRCIDATKYISQKKKKKQSKGKII